MKKFVSSLRLPLLLLFVLLLSSAAGVTLGKYVGEKPLAQNLTLTVRPREYRLISGSAFNALTVDGVALKSLPKPIIFDVMKPEYESLIAGLTPVSVAEELTASGTYVRSDQIRLYIGTDAIYVLGDGEIKANPSCAGMFSEFSGCTGITFHSFDTSNVTSMQQMFNYCNSLTSLDLSGFNTTNLTNTRSMFYYCQRLTTITVSDSFVTTGISESTNMFLYCNVLKGSRGTKYTHGNPHDKTYAHIDGGTANPGYFIDANAPALPSVMLISGQDFQSCISEPSNVKKIVFDWMNDSYTDIVSTTGAIPVANPSHTSGDAIRMYDVSDTNGRTLYVLSDYNILADSDCSNMFENLIGCKEIIFRNFDTSYVRSMEKMFYSCQSLLSLDLTGFDVSQVTNMSGMFALCMSLTDLNLSSFNTGRVHNMSTMFGACGGLTRITVSDNFTTNAVTNSQAMFVSCAALKGGHGTVFDSGHTDKAYARMDGGTAKPGYFTGTLVPSYKLIKGSDLAALISNKAAVKKVVFDWKSDSYTDIVSGVEAKPVAVDSTNEGARWPDISMYEVSDASGGITVYVLSSCKIIGNPDCNSMFKGFTGCKNFTFNNFDATLVDHMSSMFEGCSSLTSLDLSSFYTHRAKDMESMFNGCVNLESLDVSHFNVGQVTSTKSMFRDCSSLTHLDLYSFNTSRVTNMRYMFENCKKLKTIEVTFAFVTDGVSWDENMFKGCDSLVGGAGTTYNSSQVGKLYARIDIPPNTPGYFTAGPGILVRSAPAKVSANVNFEGRGIEVNPAS